MALALNPLRASLPALRNLWLRPPFAWSASTITQNPVAFALPLPGLQLTLPSLASLWDLLPPFLLAVPKKKVSHSRKAMRAANKGLKDKTSSSLPALAEQILTRMDSFPVFLFLHLYRPRQLPGVRLAQACSPHMCFVLLPNIPRLQERSTRATGFLGEKHAITLRNVFWCVQMFFSWSSYFPNM